MRWAASLDPSPNVIYIDLRSPTRNSYLAGRVWATTLWRELRRQLTSLAVIEVGEQCMLFFVGSVHQIKVCKGTTAMRSRGSTSPCRALLPRGG